MAVATQAKIPKAEGTFSIQSSHSLDGIDVTFDDERLVADAGLIQPSTLAQRLGCESCAGRTQPPALGALRGQMPPGWGSTSWPTPWPAG